MLRLRDALGGAVTETDVIAALSQAGVRVVSAFPELPAVPHPKQADLASARHSWRHGSQPRLSSATRSVTGSASSAGSGWPTAGGLDEAAIRAARDRMACAALRDPAKTPSENMLAILRTAARRPGDLDALLLSEMIERLRPLADSGFVQRAYRRRRRTNSAWTRTRPVS